MRTLYSVYDKIAEMFGPTFESINDSVAQRNFRGIVKDAYDARDYQLYKIAQFNDDLTIANSEKVCIVEGASMLNDAEAVK